MSSTHSNHTLKDFVMFDVSITVGALEVLVFVWIILSKIAKSLKTRFKYCCRYG